MADSKKLRNAVGLKLAGAGMVLALVAVIAIALVMFVGGFTPTATVTVDAPRSGLVLDPDAKVKVRGVEIGRVVSISQHADGASLELALNPDQLKLVPANAGVDIRSTTVFGAKYVNFTVPQQPSATSLQPGARVTAQHVTVEFNTLFQHLSDVLAKVEPEKLNATLSALGTALQGRGEKLGDLLARSDAYLRDINPYLPTLQQDLVRTGQVTDLYADTAPGLLRTVDNLTVTSDTLAAEQQSLDNVLANVIGLADTTGSVLRDNTGNLSTALDLLRPTTSLLFEYAPALSCLINGLGPMMPLAEDVFGGMLPGIGMNTNFMFGAKPYTYPNDLPKVNATGGPHCEGVVDRVPDSHSNYVVTDTNQGAPYVPNTGFVKPNEAPKVFQLLFAGLPGVASL
ncbi:MCE family protein [Nocardia sp. NPDC049149]|uniref:MCE family protein n=1 Tax=Nocardia sp. NPDC049149 TaxID=3364315 RepID=UPI00371926D6